MTYTNFVIPHNGLHDTLGIIFDGVTDDGHSHFHIDTDEKHLNYSGIVHGGVTYSMMDAAAATAVRAVEGPGCPIVTRSGSVHYIAAGKGKRISAEGILIQSGKSLALADAEVKDESGKLIARGEFEFFFMRGNRD